MGAIHGLRIKSPYKLLKIEDIRIENKPNEHGYLYLKCLIDDSINFDSAIKASTDDKISVYEEIEDENSSAPNYGAAVDINEVDERNSTRLFDGIVNDIKTSNVNNIYYLEIEALTSSIELDIEEKSRSFQNLDMTYDELIENILNDYSGYNFSQYIGQGEKIGRPLFQYRETDWNFLKRLASELSSELYSDIINSNDLFYFGRPDNASYELEDTKYYKAHKNLHRFREAGGYDTGYDTDYFYYELKRREQYNIGDEIYFKNKQLYVNQYSAYALKDEVIYKYRLCRKNGVWQTKLYNSLLSGASLEGKVIDRQGEQVKLQLKIDDNQNNEEASWFRFAPPTGNMMYCMPVVGTDARLYFPNESSEAPIVTGCLRTNGSSCQKTSDTTKRYLGTEHGSEIEMVPDAINIKGGSSSPLSIKFEDSIGVTLTSPKKLTMNASEEIIMKTPKSVKINAQSQIAIVKTNAGSGLAIEGDLNYKSNNVILDGTFKEPFPDFDDDEPKAGQKPEQPKEKEKKDPFNWLGVGLAVLGAAVAIVAAVAIAAVVAIPATAVLACAAIGAVVCAATDAGVQYAQYKEDGPKNKDGSKKSFGDVYRLDNTIIAACGGASSAALAATPIGRTGQALINAGIGGIQAAESGSDIALGIETGLVVGFAGGAGYMPSYIPKGFSLPAYAYRHEAANAIKDGLKWGFAASWTNNGINYGCNKVKEWFSSKSQENSNTVPAT